MKRKTCIIFVIISLCFGFSVTANPDYPEYIPGKHYLEGAKVKILEGDKCTIWMSQWWINSPPGTDPAWVRLGSCDQNFSEDSNNILEQAIKEVTQNQLNTENNGVASWLSEIQDSISDADYKALLDVAYYVRTYPISKVLQITSGNPNNPDNVKRVEKIISLKTWNELFPMTNPETAEGNPQGLGIYTYENFLKSVGMFPAYCGNYKNHPKQSMKEMSEDKAEQICRKMLATTFAHFNKETSANAKSWKTPLKNQGLYFTREYGCLNHINNNCKTNYTAGADLYPAEFQQDNSYFGRGAKQLSHPINYATLSILAFGRPDILLKSPDIVSDTWFAFVSAIYFACTPISSKPAMIEIVDGNYQPNDADKARHFFPGFGLTTHIINGGYECIAPDVSKDEERVPYWKIRSQYYETFKAKLGVGDIEDPALFNCEIMKSTFEGDSASSRPYYITMGDCKLTNLENPTINGKPNKTVIAYIGKAALQICKTNK